MRIAFEVGVWVVLAIMTWQGGNVHILSEVRGSSKPHACSGRCVLQGGMGPGCSGVRRLRLRYVRNGSDVGPE